MKRCLTLIIIVTFLECNNQSKDMIKDNNVKYKLKPTKDSVLECKGGYSFTPNFESFSSLDIYSPNENERYMISINDKYTLLLENEYRTSIEKYNIKDTTNYYSPGGSVDIYYFNKKRNDEISEYLYNNDFLYYPTKIYVDTAVENFIEIKFLESKEKIRFKIIKYSYSINIIKFKDKEEYYIYYDDCWIVCRAYSD